MSIHLRLAQVNPQSSLSTADRSDRRSSYDRPTMIDHVGLEVSDLERSARFYDAITFPLGVRRLLATDHAVAYGVEGPVLWIVARGRAPAPGFGHVALMATGRVAVDAAHRAGLAHGGSDDGPPGTRPQYGERYYAGYLRDPDGLRVEVVAQR
jgi:catechol 2,3-dioxygenase-like lactoylglutathione lyase family enzyme